MKLYSGVVKCGTCGKNLGMVSNVPESARLEAMQSASSRAFCEGHSRNSNIEVPVWTEQGGRIHVTADAGEVIPEEPKTAPKMTPDGIDLADLAAASLDDSMLPPPLPQVMGKDENGAPVPLTIIGKNAPRPDQLG